MSWIMSNQCGQMLPSDYSNKLKYGSIIAPIRVRYFYLTQLVHLQYSSGPQHIHN